RSGRVHRSDPASASLITCPVPDGDTQGKDGIGQAVDEQLPVVATRHRAVIDRNGHEDLATDPGLEVVDPLWGTGHGVLGQSCTAVAHKARAPRPESHRRRGCGVVQPETGTDPATRTDVRQDEAVPLWRGRLRLARGIEEAERGLVELPEQREI